jgi:Domain of unknown function (DUF1844)
MADSLGLQIDDDWKKQAQEEKRKLAEQTSAPKSEESAAKQQAANDPRAGARAEREQPAASFTMLVRSIMTQALMYLGELTVRAGEQMLDLDMAKYQIDLLSILEEKTKGNLSPEEQKLLDNTLFDLRGRYVSTAGRYIM